jgi:hypothetical protein
MGVSGKRWRFSDALMKAVHPACIRHVELVVQRVSPDITLINVRRRKKI